MLCPFIHYNPVMKNTTILLVSLVLLAGCGPSPSSEATLPDRMPLSSGVSQDLEARVYSLMESGDPSRALALLNEEMGENPANPEAYLILGKIMMSRKEYENAERYFLATIQLDPDSGEAFLLLGGCYDLMGKKEDALASIRRSLVIFRMNKDTRNFQRALAILRALQTPQG